MRPLFLAALVALNSASSIADEVIPDPIQKKEDVRDTTLLKEPPLQTQSGKTARPLNRREKARKKRLKERRQERLHPTSDQ